MTTDGEDYADEEKEKSLDRKDAKNSRERVSAKSIAPFLSNLCGLCVFAVIFLFSRSFPNLQFMPTQIFLFNPCNPCNP